MQALPKPRRNRDRFTLPIPLYGDSAILILPKDMTEQEAQKITRVVLAYAKITPHNAT